MADAFIKLYKKMLKWEWYDDANTKILFLHCLLKANWEPTRWHGVELEPGQFITSLSTLAKETHLTVGQVRVALDHLISTSEITSKGQSKFRIITVNSWCQYQTNDKQGNKQIANKQQTNNKQTTTVKEYKNKRKEEESNSYIYIKDSISNSLLYFPNDELLNNTFIDYISMRKQIKKPLTDRAIELAIKKVNDLSGGDNDLAIKILEQSIMNSWQGLFPLKKNNESQKGGIDWSQV